MAVSQPNIVQTPPATTSQLEHEDARTTLANMATDQASAGVPQLATLNIARLKIKPISNSSASPVPPANPSMITRDSIADYMLTVQWHKGIGWADPEIAPYGNIPMPPTASCLHYATECFEGMKAYRSQYDGKLRIFRPNLNAARFLKSALRVGLPAFSPDQFVALLKRYVGFIGSKWIPNTPEWTGHALYLRPVLVGTDIFDSTHKPTSALMYIIALLLPSGYGASTAPTGMRFLASSQDTIRAWPGGFGFAKVGANYGPTLTVASAAKERGYDNVLWLYGEDDTVTEGGIMNFFVLWRRPDGERELITPPIGDGLILDGVTRRSVVELVREWREWHGKDIKVVEKKIVMKDILLADEEGRLEEAFSCGTAAFVVPVGEIDFRGRVILFPITKSGPGAGGFAAKVKEGLEDIVYGKVQSDWAVIIDEDGLNSSNVVSHQ